MTWGPADAGRQFWRAAKLNDLADVSEVLEPATPVEANLVGSRRADGLHAPALDLDHRAHLVPSTTAGHFHLYIDVPMTWRAYRRLLRAFYRAGILDRSVYWRSLDRGSTYVRPPGVQKTEEESVRGSISAPPDVRAARRSLRRIMCRVAVRRVGWLVVESWKIARSKLHRS